MVERFAYLVRFRQVFPFPFLDDEGHFTPPDFTVFAPGGNAVFDDLCDRVLDGDSFLDVGRHPVQTAPAD